MKRPVTRALGYKVASSIVSYGGAGRGTSHRAVGSEKQRVVSCLVPSCTPPHIRYPHYSRTLAWWQVLISSDQESTGGVAGRAGSPTARASVGPGLKVPLNRVRWEQKEPLCVITVGTRRGYTDRYLLTRWGTPVGSPALPKKPIHPGTGGNFTQGSAASAMKERNVC